MRSIQELLTSHRIPGVRLSEIRSACALAAKNLVSYDVKAKDVRFKEGTVFFSVPSVVKTELHLREGDFKKTLKALGIEVSSIR